MNTEPPLRRGRARPRDSLSHPDRGAAAHPGPPARREAAAGGPCGRRRLTVRGLASVGEPLERGVVARADRDAGRRAARAGPTGGDRDRAARAARGAARCWCGWWPPACAIPTSIWPTVGSAAGAGRWCSATRARAWSQAVGEDVDRRGARRPRGVLLRAVVRGVSGLPGRAPDAVRDGRAQRRRRDADGRKLAAARARRHRAPARSDGGLLRGVRGGAGGRRGAACPRRSRCGRRRCWAAGW